MSEQLTQQLMNWITLGAIYALVAVGFSLLFGVLNIIHFSHADISFVSPFLALAAIQALSTGLGGLQSTWGMLLILAGSALLVGLLGVLLYFLIIRRFQNTPAMMALVATVALGITLRELIRHVFPQGSNPHAAPRLVSGSIDAFGFRFPLFNIWAIGISVSLVTLLFLLLNCTKTGTQIRAVSQDTEAARLFSISPARVFLLTFFLASTVGAVGGLFFSGYVGIVRFDFSVDIGLIGFSAAVVGGLGSMPGAIFGSLLIAGLDTFVQAFVPNGASYRLVFVFLLVIAVLVFRPAGLFGRVAIEKV